MAIRGAKAERITPACAGNSIDEGMWDYIAQDHPRVCGE